MDLELVTQANTDADNPDIGDLRIVNNEIALIDGKEAVAQQIAIRFKFFLGEWYLNRSEGFPWIQVVFVKRPNMGKVRALVREVLGGTPRVVAIHRLELSVSSDRILSVRFEVGIDTGVILSSDDFGTFQLGV